MVCYLSSRNAKVGKYAIFLILVSRVGLETLAPAVVPQLEGVVQRGGQDVLAVGAELDEGHGGVVVVYQRLEALARRCVPYATQPVVAGGDYEGAISVEVDGGYGIRMCGKGF